MLVDTPQHNADLHFPSTHWSSVVAAGHRESEEGRSALGRMLTRYRPALKAYLMEKFRYGEDQALDLLQDFVLEVVLKKELIAGARRIPGTKFRSYILCALHNFGISEYRRNTALKRRPVGGLASLDELRELDFDPAGQRTTPAVDANWARSVLAQALERLQEQCEAQGRQDLWSVFEQRLVRPVLDDAAPSPYEALVEQHGLKSSAHAQNLLYKAKKMFAQALRSVVAEYAEGDSEIESELRELQAILAEAR